jgi:hypothetical protein
MVDTVCSCLCAHEALVSGLLERRFSLTELNSDRPVRVTAEQRAHPALRRLARACIAIALLQLADESSSAQSTASAPMQPAEQLKDEPSASGQEASND